VFDAAMLIALFQFDREDVLAGLLLFRLVYYIIPFALALLILGLRELVLNLHFSRAQSTGPGPVEPPRQPLLGEGRTALDRGRGAAAMSGLEGDGKRPATH
jgi:hypothetical protein